MNLFGVALGRNELIVGALALLLIARLLFTRADQRRNVLVFFGIMVLVGGALVQCAVIPSSPVGSPSSAHSDWEAAGKRATAKLLQGRTDLTPDEQDAYRQSKSQYDATH